MCSGCQGNSNEPAFTGANPRSIDPCGLLGADTLSHQGRPSGNSSSGFVGRPTGFDNCDIDMVTYHNDDLSVGVMVGVEVTTTVGSRGALSGMPVLEQPNTEECAEQILTPGVDTCAKALPAAKAVLTKVPRPN